MPKHGPILTCRACCPRCGLHFAGDRAFDLHLGGPKSDPPWSHQDPRDVFRKDGSPALTVKTREGTCRMIVDRPEHPIAIWQVPPTGWHGPLP